MLLCMVNMCEEFVKLFMIAVILETYRLHNIQRSRKHVCVCVFWVFFCRILVLSVCHTLLTHTTIQCLITMACTLLFMEAEL